MTKSKNLWKYSMRLKYVRIQKVLNKNGQFLYVHDIGTNFREIGFRDEFKAANCRLKL